jgi:hypothetical protein
MFQGAVPRPHDVVKVLTGEHHDDLCTVTEVINGIVTMYHGINNVFPLPLKDVVVMFRPGMREHVE